MKTKTRAKDRRQQAMAPGLVQAFQDRRRGSRTTPIGGRGYQRPSPNRQRYA